MIHASVLLSFRNTVIRQVTKNSFNVLYKVTFLNILLMLLVMIRPDGKYKHVMKT